jgi:probable phosphoglycerate mutase
MRDSSTVPDMPLAAIFSSTLTRSIETMSEIKAIWEKDPEISRGDFGRSTTYLAMLENLREIDLWEWQARDKKELSVSFPEAWTQWGRDPARFVLPESGKAPVLDLWARADRLWDNIRGASPGFVADEECVVDGDDPASEERCAASWLSRCDPDRRVLVVGHNAVNQALLCTACGLGPENFRKYGFKNGGVAEVEWADGEPLARR